MRASKWVFLLASVLPLASQAEEQVASGSAAMSRAQAIGIMAGWTAIAAGALAWVAIAEGRHSSTQGPPNTTGKK